MAVTIAACRTLTAARPLALASRVSWFRLRAMPLSWAMKSSCSRVIRALTVPRSISWRRTSAGGCPASRQRAEKRSFRSGLSRVLTTYFADAADADFRASALFAVCFLRCFHDEVGL